MGRLVYSGITSLDGYTVDATGDFSWAAPDAEVHGFVNDLVRGEGLHLLGRRMYEVMVFWETAGNDPDDPPEITDFAQGWRASDKVVYSTTLAEVTAPRTRLERSLDLDAVRDLVADAPTDVSIGGPTLAAEALRAGLVDELWQITVPAVVGGGTPFLPNGRRADLRRLDVKAFAGGAVYQRHAVLPTAPA